MPSKEMPEESERRQSSRDGNRKFAVAVSGRMAYQSAFIICVKAGPKTPKLLCSPLVLSSTHAVTCFTSGAGEGLSTRMCSLPIGWHDAECHNQLSSQPAFPQVSLPRVFSWPPVPLEMSVSRGKSILDGFAAVTAEAEHPRGVKAPDRC